MSEVLYVTQLDDGDIVLSDDGEELLRIRFSGDMQDMLGEDALSVAEAMIDAATAAIEAAAGDVSQADAVQVVH